MVKKSKTKTTIEAHEVYIVKAPHRLRPLCAQCEAPQPMISVEEAVRITGASSRALHRWIEAGEVHFQETSEGLTLICPFSLISGVADKPFRQNTNEEEVR